MNVLGLIFVRLECPLLIALINNNIKGLSLWLRFIVLALHALELFSSLRDELSDTIL